METKADRLSRQVDRLQFTIEQLEETNDDLKKENRDLKRETQNMDALEVSRNFCHQHVAEKVHFQMSHSSNF